MSAIYEGDPEWVPFEEVRPILDDTDWDAELAALLVEAGS